MVTTAMLAAVTPTNTPSPGSGTVLPASPSDRINLIAATTLIGVFYGIMATLYFMTSYFLVKKLKLCLRNPRSGSHPNSFSKSKMEFRMTVFYLVYTSVLFILSTLYTAGNSQNAIVDYVDNRTYPEGPYAYYVAFMAGQPVMVLTDVTSLIILWMTDALILYRFVMFYSKVPYARWIIPLPCVMYVGVIAGSTLVLQGEGLGKIYLLSRSMVLAYYALSFSLNMLTTLLIAARLYWHKIQVERVLGTRADNPYMSIATVLIESAALYGVWSFATLILCMVQSPGQTIFMATVSQIQVIAPLLIILWSARGKAWNGNKNYVIDSVDKPPRKWRFSFHSRPSSRAAGAFRFMDNPSKACRYASSSRDAKGKEAEHDIDDKLDVIEIGLCDSAPSTATHNDVSLEGDSLARQP